VEENPIWVDKSTPTHGHGSTITVRVEEWKVCKNLHGLKIHQAKMLQVSVQRSGTTPGETQDEPGSESPHSAQNLQVTQAPDPHRATDHRRVKWPQASKEKRWLQFDKDANGILKAMAKGEADHHLQSMTTIIVSLAAERFGP